MKPLYLCSMKILMVCLGNICRSPIAEGLLQHKAKMNNLNWQVDSAATLNEMVGCSPDKNSIIVSKKNGIDISNQIARKIKVEDFENFDLIYAMASDVLEDIKFMAGKNYDPEKMKLLLDEVFPGQYRDIPDPYMLDISSFENVYRLIDEATDEIIKKYKN